MKKALLSTLCLTAVTIVLFYISDIVFNTAYLGVTVFQPVPHLILFSLVALDLYFWYQVRNNSHRKGKATNRKTWLDYFILFLLASLVFSTILLVFDSISIKLN